MCLFDPCVHSPASLRRSAALLLNLKPILCGNLLLLGIFPDGTRTLEIHLSLHISFLCLLCLLVISVALHRSCSRAVAARFLSLTPLIDSIALDCWIY